MKITPAKAAKRKAIALDVIAWIKAQKFVAVTGTYLQADVIADADAGEELQKVLKKATKRKPCHVCVLGAIFASCVLKFDQFKLTEYNHDGDEINSRAMHQKLVGFFNRSELGVIESSFERSSGFIRTDTGDYDTAVGVQFEQAMKYRDFLGFMDSEDRLLWLMNAVVALAGEQITLAGLRYQALRTIVADPKLARRFSLI